MLNRRHALKTLAGTALAAPAILHSAPALAATVQSVKTHEYMEYIGINVHTDFGSSGDPWDSVSWHQPLLDLQIRYIRTGLNFNSDDFPEAHLTSLYNGGGVRSLINVVGQAQGSECTLAGITPAFIHGKIDDAIALGPKLFALEGPNEWDHFCGTTWNDLRDIQREIWNYCRALVGGVERYGGVIVGPTIWQNDLSDFQALGATNIDLYMGPNNLHLYPDRSLPSRWSADSNTILEAYQNAQLVKPNTPSVWTTEAGYSIHRVPVDCQSKYLGRLFMEHFRTRLTSSDPLSQQFFHYALMDNPVEPGTPGNMGLMDRSYTKRPSYWTIYNLHDKLDDAQWSPTTGWAYHKNFAPAALDIVFTNAPATMKSVLMQKANGKFYLVCWNDIASQSGGVDIVNPPVSVGVALGQTFSSIAYFDVSVLTADMANPTGKGTTDVATNKTQTGCTIPLRDRVGVLVLTP